MRAKDIRKGNVIMHNKVPHRVLDFAHRTPGNLRAFVQMKLRNVMNGSQTEARFASDDDLEFADLSTYNASFLYSDESGFHFMNSENYEQIALQPDLVGEAKYYLIEEMVVEISTLDERPIGISLPKTVTLEVVETAPEIKGATATNVGKPATMNTGLVVTVPPFIKQGEKIIVDTTDGSYLSRAD